MADQIPRNEGVPEPPKAEDRRAKLRAKDEQALGQDDNPDDLDDFDDLINPEYGRLTIGMRVMYFLLVLGMAVMVGYLVLIVLYPDEYGARDWIGSKAEKEPKQAGPGLVDLKSFQMGGINMGITPDQAKTIYPSMRLETNPNAGPNAPTAQRGIFVHHGGDFEVFFRGPKRGNRAYRVHSVHTFSKISYLELLTELSGRYGKPGKSECAASEKIIGIECKLYWRTGQTVIDAEIRTNAPIGAEAQTTLTVTAKDTRPDRFFQQIKSKKTGDPNRKLKDVVPAK
ncbi:MAG: hypothetical protein HQ512_13485 [Rhodospirillales bacterium]|nr:hypothetical protein [Rhodospirillales bacterium]